MCAYAVLSLSLGRKKIHTRANERWMNCSTSNSSKGIQKNSFFLKNYGRFLIVHFQPARWWNVWCRWLFIGRGFVDRWLIWYTFCTSSIIQCAFCASLIDMGWANTSMSLSCHPLNLEAAVLTSNHYIEYWKPIFWNVDITNKLHYLQRFACVV